MSKNLEEFVVQLEAALEHKHNHEPGFDGLCFTCSPMITIEPYLDMANRILAMERMWEQFLKYQSCDLIRPKMLKAREGKAK